MTGLMATGATVVSKSPATQKRPVKKIKGKITSEKAERALFCLRLKNPIRKLCIAAIEWKYPFLIFILKKDVSKLLNIP